MAQGRGKMEWGAVGDTRMGAPSFGMGLAATGRIYHKAPVLRRVLAGRTMEIMNPLHYCYGPRRRGSLTGRIPPV